jgi:hypothetical protein
VAISDSRANGPEILLAGIQEQRNMALVVVTHEEEVARCAHRRMHCRRSFPTDRNFSMGAVARQRPGDAAEFRCMAARQFRTIQRRTAINAMPPAISRNAPGSGVPLAS